MILILLAIWFGFKKARDTGRNPWLWAAISGGVFLVTQFLAGLVFGVLIVIGQQIWGWSEDEFNNFYLPLANIPAIILSIVALWLVFRFLDKPKAEVTPPMDSGREEI
ncbi:MAG: hypothetical protein ACKVRN_03785 [Pyrinomonadaceae bacterium]